MAGVEDADLLAEQRAYYRQRAPEYDDWWRRQGPYDLGDEHRREWEAEVLVLSAALERFEATGDVLELAGGTGWWTSRLAATADRLTVVDASAETLELNRRRVGRDDVRYVIGDIFEYAPEGSERFDVVFFSFWLSHVPRDRFAAFWAMVGRCLRPGGRVFLIDNRLDPGWSRPDPYLVTEGDIQQRRLSDGSVHRVVKVMYEPAELEAVLAGVGWTAAIEGIRWFIYGSARPA